MRHLLVTMVLLLAGCSGSPAGVHVFAASSLTDVFKEVGGVFAAEGAAVEFAFGGSQTLRTQIEHGAPADLFATADVRHLEALGQTGRLTERWALVRNELVVVVPETSEIRRFDELADVGSVVLGAPAVPAGVYARVLIDRLRLQQVEVADALLQRIVSEEPNVRMVRSKIELGVADAGIVYRTDALATDRVRIIDMPEESRTWATYGFGVTDSAGEDTESFARFLRSGRAAEVFERHGFEWIP